MALIDHAERELARLGNDDDFNRSILRAIQGFTSYGHSGGSAPYAIALLSDLLQFKNVTPLTEDPDEWIQHSSAVWQNRRRSGAFSDDGGKTYWLLEEGAHQNYPYPRHKSEPIPEQGEKSDSRDGCSVDIQAEEQVVEMGWTLEVEDDVDRRHKAWATAKLLIDEALDGIELVEYENNGTFGSKYKVTVLKQRLDHIRQMADWLLNGTS
jgi:hypothetical protein